MSRTTHQFKVAPPEKRAETTKAEAAVAPAPEALQTDPDV